MDRNAEIIRDWESRWLDPDNDDFYNGYHECWGYPDEEDDEDEDGVEQ